MAKIHVYLNFNGNCKEAFNFYSSVFDSPVLNTSLYGEMPPEPGSPSIPEEAKNLVLHTMLMINESTMLMGSDIFEGFGQKLTNGNATYIMIDANSREEARGLYNALSKDAKNLEMELGETFFAELFSSFEDKYGIFWMIHFEGSKKMA